MGIKTLSSRAIIGRFYDRLQTTQGASWADATTMMFTSDQESETYKWLGMTPTLREWIGGRHAKGFRENGITITNKLFEATLEVNVDDLRRDKTGQTLVRIDEMADRAVEHDELLLSTLITDGETTACYDGQFFFDIDHSEGDSGTQSNDITVDISAAPAAVHGTPTNPSVEEVQEMVLSGAQQMLGLLDDQGQPVNTAARNFLIMVPTSYFKRAAAAIKSPVVGRGDTNVMQSLDGFTFSLAINPRLTWTDKLAMFRTDGATSAFIKQVELETQIRAVAEGSELEFNENVHHYGVKKIGQVGYGKWDKACLVQAV